MSDFNRFILLTPPIYYDTIPNPLLGGNNYSDNTNVIDRVDSNLPPIWTQKDMHSPRESANEIIRKHRCNSVLDLTSKEISSQTWKEIQSIIIEGIWPPITHVNLTGSNISRSDIDARIESLVQINWMQHF